MNTSNKYPKLIKGQSVKFSGNYVKENKPIYPDFHAQNCLFDAVKLTKDVNTSNYQYKGFEICFDEGSQFSIGNIVKERNVIMFGCDLSSSSHSTNRTNNIYVLGKNFIQGINGTTIYAEKIYKTNFTEPSKKVCIVITQ